MYSFVQANLLTKKMTRNWTPTNSNDTKHKGEWTFCWCCSWQGQVIDKGGTCKHRDSVPPFWLCSKVFLKPLVFEEEFGVSPNRGNQIRSHDDTANGLLFTTLCLWAFESLNLEEWIVSCDASGCQVLPVRHVIDKLIRHAAVVVECLIWLVARVIWDQSHHEWPFRVFFSGAKLIVIGKVFDAHVSNELADLRKFGMCSL